MKMLRRSWLAMLGLLGSVSGCLDQATGDKGIKKRQYPDEPNELTEASVLDYVTEYEHTERHNEITDDDVTEIRLSCDAFVDRVIADTYYVVAACSGTVERTSGGPVSHEDVERTPPVTYLVTEDRTHRFNEIGYDLRPGTDERKRALRVANFDETEHVIEVAITPGRTEDDTTITETFVLTASSDQEHLDVVSDDQTHDVRATLDGETESTYEWVIGTDLGGVGVYVTPDGNLDINALETDWP